MARIDLHQRRFIVQGIELRPDPTNGTWTTQVELEQLVFIPLAGWLVDAFSWPVVGLISRGQSDIICVFAYARVRCVDGSIVWGKGPADMGEYGIDQIGLKRLVSTSDRDYAIVSMISEDGGTTWEGWNIVLWNTGFRDYFTGAPPMGGGGDFHNLRVTPFQDGFLFGFVSGRDVYMMYTEDGRTWQNRRFLFNLDAGYDGLPTGSFDTKSEYWHLLGIDADGDGKRELLMAGSSRTWGRFTGGSGYHSFTRFSADQGETWTPWKWYWTDHCGVSPYGGCPLIVGRGNTLPISYGTPPGICRTSLCGGTEAYWYIAASSTWEIHNWQGYAAYIDNAPVRPYVTHVYDDEGQRWVPYLGLFTTGSNVRVGVSCMTRTTQPINCCYPTINSRWGGMYLLLFERAFSSGVTAAGDVQANSILDPSLPMPSICFSGADRAEGYTASEEPDSRAVHWWACNGYFYEPYGPGRGYHRVSLATRSYPNTSWCPEVPNAVGDWGGKMYPIEGMLWHPDWMTVTELGFQRVGLAGTWLNPREGCNWPLSVFLDLHFFFDTLHGKGRPERYFQDMKFQTKNGPLTLSVTKTMVWVRTMDDPARRDFEGWFGTNYYETVGYVDS